MHGNVDPGGGSWDLRGGSFHVVLTFWSSRLDACHGVGGLSESSDSVGFLWHCISLPQPHVVKATSRASPDRMSTGRIVETAGGGGGRWKNGTLTPRWYCCGIWSVASGVGRRGVTRRVHKRAKRDTPHRTRTCEHAHT